MDLHRLANIVRMLTLNAYNKQIVSPPQTSLKPFVFIVFNNLWNVRNWFTVCIVIRKQTSF